MSKLPDCEKSLKISEPLTLIGDTPLDSRERSFSASGKSVRSTHPTKVWTLSSVSMFVQCLKSKAAIVKFAKAKDISRKESIIDGPSSGSTLLTLADRDRSKKRHQGIVQ